MSNYNINNKFYKEMCERVGEDFRAWLDRKYWDEELNTRQMAELAYGKIKNSPNIRGWMKKLDIPIRDRSSAVALQWKDNPERKALASESFKKRMGANEKGREKLIAIMQTKEYREKASKAKMGAKNGMYGVRGDKHPKWNSELTEEERLIKRAYPEYTEWRRQVYERDKYTCQICGDNKGGNLVAHHLNGYHWDKKARVDINNGVTLCESCHNDFHSIYGYGDNNIFQFAQYQEMTISSKAPN